MRRPVFLPTPFTPPRMPSPQSIRSVARHSISLRAILDRGVETGEATKMIQRAPKQQDRFAGLPPPPSKGELTIADVHRAENAQEEVQLVYQWTQSAWAAWSDHHPTIRK